MVAAAAATALRVRLGFDAAAHAGRDARPPWAEVAENAALEPPSQRVALRSPGWLLCMCSIVVAFHGRASKVCGVVGEAATSRCLGGPEAPLEASPDDACAREPRPGSAETGAAAAPGSASAIIKDSPALFSHFAQPFSFPQKKRPHHLRSRALQHAPILHTPHASDRQGGGHPRCDGDSRAGPGPASASLRRACGCGRLALEGPPLHMVRGRPIHGATGC